MRGAVLLVLLSLPAPAAANIQTFEALARAVAAARGERLSAFLRLDLDRDGREERIAVLCGEDRVAWIVEEAVDTWLVALEDLDGRATVVDCDGEARVPGWKTRRDRWLAFTEGHSGGYDTWRIAFRGRRPVIVWHELLNDTRDGDRPVRTDYDRRKVQPGLETLSRAITSAYAVPLTSAVLAVLRSRCPSEECEALGPLRQGHEGRTFTILATPTGSAADVTRWALRTAALLGRDAELLRVTNGVALDIRAPGTVVETGIDVNGDCFAALMVERARLGAAFVAGTCREEGRITAWVRIR